MALYVDGVVGRLHLADSYLRAGSGNQPSAAGRGATSDLHRVVHLLLEH